ncbi:MAG TPA: hypothetical protein VM686_14105 [Polyangiaceae bacterium]|nr:hypothetical protein [Polyangiaceae bacterium]
MLESGRSRWLRVFLAPAAALIVFLVTSPAHAYNWMIKHGYGGCPVCHADPTGGELLTKYGRDMGDQFLRMRYGETGGASESGSTGTDFGGFDDFDEEDSAKPEAKQEEEKPKEEVKPAEPSKFPDFLFGAVPLPDPLLMGGSARLAWTLKEGDFRIFPMQLDVYGQLRFGDFRVGGSLGVSKVPVGSPHARAAQLTSGQGDQWNLISRSHWVGMDFMNQEITLRLGRMNVPFGLRIPEHVMWVREATRTDRESDQQGGLALAYNGSDLRGEILAIAGNYSINPDMYRERGYSLYLEYMTSSRAAVGISSLVTKAARDRLYLNETDVLRMAHGAFVRGTLGDPFVLLVEADLLKRSATEMGYVGMIQLDYEPTQGLHFIATGEVLDNGYPEGGGPTQSARVEGQGKPKLGGWLSAAWFFYTHFDVRVDAIKRQTEPFTILGQLHVYL